jgi:hypothetical protein
VDEKGSHPAFIIPEITECRQKLPQVVISDRAVGPPPLDQSFGDLA